LNSSILLDEEWSDGAAACTSDAPEDEESIALLGVGARRWGVPALRRSMSLGSGQRWLTETRRWSVKSIMVIQMAQTNWLRHV
jgi:hypothetical protein